MESNELVFRINVIMMLNKIVDAQECDATKAK